jgi:hypothetical protein
MSCRFTVPPTRPPRPNATPTTQPSTSWHWDPATFARLQGRGRERVRLYLEAEHAHLLRAYEADFLLEAVETARARCQERAEREQPVLAHYAARDFDNRQAA